MNKLKKKTLKKTYKKNIKKHERKLQRIEENSSKRIIKEKLIFIQGASPPRIWRGGYWRCHTRSQTELTSVAISIETCFSAIFIVIFVCALFPEYIVIEGGATLTFDVRLVQHNQMR